MTSRSLVPSTVAEYLEELGPEPDPGMAIARELAEETGHDWAISPGQGQCLELLARSIKTVRALEIGTFCGYSALWLARAILPGGRVRSVDRDDAMLERAARSLAASCVGHLVHLERGDALGILAAAPTDSEDLIFIDGAKIEYPEYFAEALRICRVGGLIIADNTLYGGQVSLPAKDDPRTRAIRRYNALAFSRQDVMSTVLPIGDGFTVSLRLA